MYDELYDSILAGKFLRPEGEEIKPEWPVMAYTTRNRRGVRMNIQPIALTRDFWSLKTFKTDFVEI